MFKINSAKITQIQDFLSKQIALVKNTVYYLQPVNILTLEKVLNFDWEKNKTKFFFVSSQHSKSTPLPEEKMQRIFLELDFDFKNISHLHFYEQIQFLFFAHLPAVWKERALVVTVMGHVDHGKTTFLDTIRSSDLARREQGKITQKIGGYQVEHAKNKITFIDTPGHQLFTSMRTQGVNVTDLIILVVAGNEGVKAQTVEAINHAQAAKLPVVNFINKMDLPLSNFERVKKQIDAYDLKHALFNNRSFFLQGNALKKATITPVLQRLCDLKQKLPLQVNFNSLVKAVVLDSKISSQGPQATIIIQKGTLRIKDPIIVGSAYGKVKLIINDLNQQLQQAVPGMCVVVLGLSAPVKTGDLLFSFPDFKLVLNLANQFAKLDQTPSLTNKVAKTLDPLQLWKNSDTSNNLNLIIKLDTQGSEQVLKSQIKSLASDDSKFKLNFVHTGIGAITFNDLNLAVASQGIILTFNLKMPSVIATKIKQKNIAIKFYNFTIFSHLFDYLQNLRQGKAIDQVEEKIVGQAKILKIFQHSKFGVIAGCVVEQGVIKVGTEKFKVFRNEQKVGDSLKIKSLKHEKEVIKLAVLNQEFGIIFDNFSDLKVGDRIQQFTFSSLNEK